MNNPLSGLPTAHLWAFCTLLGLTLVVGSIYWMIETDRRFSHEVYAAGERLGESIAAQAESEMKKPVDRSQQERLREIIQPDDSTTRIVVVRLEEAEYFKEVVDATALLVQYYISMVCLPIGIVVSIVGVLGWRRREALVEGQIAAQINKAVE